MIDDATSAEYRALFEEMRDAWSAAPLPAAVAVAMDSRKDHADATAFQVAYGWMAHIIRTGEAVLLLASSGFEHEAAPLVRTVFEHAIALRWLEDMRGDAVQVLVRMRGRSAERLRDWQPNGWTMGDGDTQKLIQATIDVETDEDTFTYNVFKETKKRAEQYKLGELYQMWLVRTWYSHPSVQTALRHSEPTSSENIRLSPTPVRPALPVAVDIVVTVGFALQQYDKFLPDHPLSPRFADWLSRGGELKSRVEEALRKDGT